jgi:formyltetrahydrofolate deformylase
MSATATLLISCRDRPGLVADVARFIYEGNGNILHADQHTDQEEGVFLQRVEWQLDGFVHDRSQIADQFRPIAEKHEMTWSLHFSEDVPRAAVLVSKLGHCLYDLLARKRMSQLRAEIPVVISNHPDLAHVAEEYEVDFLHLPVTPETKADQEERMLGALETRAVEVLVLARYMQVLSPTIVERYPNRIVNIHHSFLPAFAGARPYHQAHERGVKIIGATAHYATAELDAGPIIEQDVVRVSHRDSVSDLIAKGQDLEKVVLARALKYHLDRRVLVYGNKTVVFD